MENELDLSVNAVKKHFYKTSPVAEFRSVNKSGITYVSDDNLYSIIFIVPLDDIGDATFENTMPAKHLIRYISHIDAQDSYY